jgi:hypothetical protein
MVRKNLMGLLVGGLMVSLASFAWAGIPDLDASTATGERGTEWVSIYSQPDGGGNAIGSVAYILGATPPDNEVDATVTLTLLDNDLQPVPFYAFEDLWIESSLGSIVYCPGGTTADQSTDEDGITTWSAPLFAGGHSAVLGDGTPDPNDGLIVVVNGSALSQDPLPYHFNSADISGAGEMPDLVVDLIDIVEFAGVLFGDYNYKADFFWDLTVNLPDIVLFSGGLEARCP